MGERGTLFVTGASGYIGGRLVPRLLDAGWRVRCLARTPRKLEALAWAADPRVEIVEGDLADPAGLDRAMRGCAAAYYLVHAMLSAGADYARRDREMAAGFVNAADRAGVERIVYLGGLGELGDDLSEHLRSRRQVEELLAGGRAKLTAFRAAMIVGSGSASFETLRYLVERLPAMITPKWVRTECQPIAVRNVLEYLVRCLDVPETAGETLDIGCPEILSYQAIMDIMAEERGLPRRLVLPVPFLTPKLSSLWIHLVTPIPARLARPLAEGLRNRVVCRDDRARRLMPQDLLTVREAIRRALERIEARDVETVWSTSGPIPSDPDWAGGTVFVDRRETEVAASASAVFRAICRIGGGNGWYAADGLWRLRGWMDRLVGGPGLRRGRRDPERVAFGEALDFWRVVGIAPDRRLALRAEMKLPGEALLEFEIEDGAAAGAAAVPGGRGVRLTQTARFRPKGLFGLLYWYAVLPLHHVVFRGMLQGIRREAESG